MYLQFFFSSAVCLHFIITKIFLNFQVQTEDQYVFIHEALLEAVMAGTTEIPCRNLHQYIQSLMQTEPGENITSMELEFKKLSNLATTEPQRSDTLFLRFPMY